MQRIFSSLSVRLQATAIFLSFVGVAFGIKTYLHVKHQFGAEAASSFFSDLMLQLVVALIVNVVVAVVLYRITTRPIKTLGEAMQRLAADELDIEVPYTRQHTEIGEMARTVEVFKQDAIEKQALEKAQHDNEKRQQVEKKKAMESLANRFELQVQVITEEVQNEVEKVRGLANEMSTLVQANASRSNAAASAADDASRDVSSVASAAEEMTASVREVAAQIEKSSHSVRSAVSANEKANQVARTLETAASKIGEIVSLIQSIAAQINLLALNATIESARAGEAGKGFAVVAGEVKNLADQTGKATDEISGQIVNIQEVSKQVMEALTTISGSIEQVAGYATSISSAIHQQSSATTEIAHSIASVANRTQQMSSDIGEVNHSSATAETHVGNTIKAVEVLAANTERLNTAMEAFLDEVRAG